MNPLSKSKIKYIKSLQLKKNRLQEDKFIVEGRKTVLEFLDSNYTVEEVIATKVFFDEFGDRTQPVSKIEASEKELSNLGSFQSNNAALAIVRIKHEPLVILKPNDIALALDSINDPGNLGTIIRIADWFGIENILVSSNSVDVYNPKVVTATKGSLTRVNIHYTDLKEYFTNFGGNVYAAYLNGEHLETIKPIDSGIILMGSESHGISEDYLPHINHKVTISGKGGAESLNVAVATGIICHYMVKNT
jgi:TrmH family RNA methyltransferase